MKTHCMGKNYMVQEITLGGDRMYVVARSDGGAVYMAYTSLEQALRQIRSTEKGADDDR